MTTTTSTKLTAEEFFEFVHRPENRHKLFELDHGEVVEMPPPDERHCLVCGNVATTLNLYVRQRRKGYVLCNDSGIVLERGPDTVRGPDVVFFNSSRPYKDMSPKFAEGIPTLAVEVWSPSDRPGKMARRVAQYLRAGVLIVWIIDPEERDVTVHRPGKEEVVFDFNQELTGEDALPDFRCPVAEFFYSAADDPGA
jgi:Uma2 family endonuclease